MKCKNAIYNNYYYIVITPFFPSETSFRGPFIFDQVKAIMSLTDYKVIVIKTGGPGGDLTYDFEGIKVHQVKIKDLPSYILPGLFMKQNVNKVLTLIKRLTDDKFDNIVAIHGHTAYSAGVLASTIANKIGAKSIVQHHGFDVMGYGNGRLKSKFFKTINRSWINKRLVNYLNKATWNVGVSQRTLEELHKVPGYNPTKEYVFYNGVNLNSFYPIQGLRDKNYFTIGCIGNFWPLKDQITLIKAVELLIQDNIKNIRVKFIGTGITRDECEQYVDANVLNQYISFIDEMPHKELVRFYNSLDLFVLPSYWEAFGCVYTEAHASGVPFIGVYGQGIEEVVPVDKKNITLIKKGDYESLSKLILYHYNNTVDPSVLINPDINNLVIQFLKRISL